MTVLSADHALVQDVSDRRRSRRIQAFHPAVRARIAELTSTSRAIEDLADSFPALLFALATGYGTPAGRRQALRLVTEGLPLKPAAAAAGVAWWARRLPAQAFCEPLHPLPDDEAFNERIASLLPARPEQARSWLWMVSYGAQACHAGLALWAASWASRQPRTFDAVIDRDQYRYLAAWAWHAAHVASPGYHFLRRPWTPQMGLRRATDELAVWRRRLRLTLCLGEGIDEPWIADGAALGFTFVALRTPADFMAESEAMDNCLDQFADRLEAGRSRVYSVRKGGRSVANLELCAEELEIGMPIIRQLRGPRNRRTQPDIWQATYAWLGSQPLRPLMPSPVEHTSTELRRAARAFWKPYLTAVGPDIAAEFAATLSADLGFRIDGRSARRQPARRKSAPRTSSAPAIALAAGPWHS